MSFKLAALVPLKALTSSVRCRIFFVHRASVGSENNPAGCSADRTWQFLCEECPVAVSSIKAKMKMRFEVSTQVSKVVGVILLVCGLQLFGQQTASGEDDAPKPPKYITFDLPGAATGPVYIQAMAINPAGAITGWYYDANTVGHGFLRARDGTLITLDVSGAGTSYPQGTFATGITPQAAISGYYIDGSGVYHGFLRAPNGTYTTFDAPPSQGMASTGITPLAINPAGTTTGWYSDAGYTQHCFLRTRNGTFTNIDPPGALYYQQQIQGNAINPAGAITGNFEDSSLTTHGFLWAPNGTFTTFDGSPGAQYTVPSGINPAGAITGYYFQNLSGYVGPQGFLRSPNGTISPVVYPASYQTSPSAINPAGTITGNYVDLATFQYHGFLRARNGKFTTFDVPFPGAYYPNPSTINPAGEIAGWYYDANGTHGFLRIPAQQDE